jgi:guanylate kinase
MADKGLIIVVSAPSGAGKSTLCKELLGRFPNLKRSISFTTRAPRIGEKNKIDYFFVSKEEFKKMVSQNKFAEWANVHDYYYGTPKEYLDKTINAGKDAIMSIDVQGALRIKKSYPKAVMIFIKTPSMKVLEQRLRNRRKDNAQVISKRLRNAKKELSYLPRYSYLVINDSIGRAVKELSAIIIAEHRKIENQNISKLK